MSDTSYFSHRVGGSWATSLATFVVLFALIIAISDEIQAFTPLRGRAALFVARLVLGVGVGVIFYRARLPKVSVNSTGIRCYTLWGGKRTIAWTDIDRAKMTNILGLRYARVWSSGGGSPIWVPLFLADMPRFHVTVRQKAGAENALCRCLSDGGA